MSFARGDRVATPDGRFGTVVATSPGMARVRFDGGDTEPFAVEELRHMDEYDTAEASLDYTPRPLDEVLDVLGGAR